MCTFILMTSWLFSGLQLSQIISCEITAIFSLKIPSKQINTLVELLNSKLSLVAYTGFIELQNVHDKSVLNQINQKIAQDNSIVDRQQMFQNKRWIVETSIGKSAIFLATIPLKMIIITHLKSIDHDTKFHFLEEKYRQTMLITLAMSMKLSKEYRSLINLR